MKKIAPKVFDLLKAIILPIILILLFSFGTGGKFFAARTLSKVLKQALFPTLIAWGVCFNMQMGVFDFSPGSVIVLSGIIGGNLAIATGTGMVGMIILTIAIAAALCTLNCLIFTKFKIPSIILGLGVLMIYETGTAVLFGGHGVSIPPAWRILYSEPLVFFIFIGAYLILTYINKYTKFASDVRALGNGTKVAMNIGLDITKTRFKSFLLEGIMLGFAAVIDMSMTGGESAVQSMASGSTAFAAIMAVFVGLYLAKYCGLMLGTFIGAFSLKILASGTIALGLSAQMQKVSNGIFLIVFVGIAQNISKISDLKERKKEIRKIQKMIEEKDGIGREVQNG